MYNNLLCQQSRWPSGLEANIMHRTTEYLTVTGHIDADMPTGTTVPACSLTKQSHDLVNCFSQSEPIGKCNRAKRPICKQAHQYLYDWFHDAGYNSSRRLISSTMRTLILIHSLCYEGSVNVLHVASPAKQLLPCAETHLRGLPLVPHMALQLTW